MRRDYPERPFVGVGVVVWRDDKVLLIQRGKEPRKGQWSLPGGAQELGETVAETAVREVAEETGVAIQVLGLVDVVDTIRRDGADKVQYHYTLVDLCARWRDGELCAGGDADDAIWVAPDQLADYALWEETARIIEQSRSLLST